MTEEEIERLSNRYYEHPDREQWAEIIGRERQTVLEFYDDAPGIVAYLLAELKAERARSTVLRRGVLAYVDNLPEYHATFCLMCGRTVVRREMHAEDCPVSVAAK